MLITSIRNFYMMIRFSSDQHHPPLILDKCRANSTLDKGKDILDKDRGNTRPNQIWLNDWCPRYRVGRTERKTDGYGLLKRCFGVVIMEHWMTF